MEWMKLLSPLKLTSSGRPELFADEVECCLVGNADLDAEGLPPLKAGIVIFTTHRILWIDQNNCKGGFLLLSSIIQIFPPKKSIKNMFTTPRIKLQICLSSSGAPCPHSQNAPTSSMLVSIILRNQSAGIDSAFSKLAEILQAKAWRVNLQHQQDSRRVLMSQEGVGNSLSTEDVSGPSRLKPAMAGVSGILRREQEQWEETDKNLHDAFLDLKALMSKAKEMVVLAEKMRAKLLAAPTVQAESTDDEDLKSRQEMQDWMLSVGIASPVTKETAGALYHQQLSRQLADFVYGPLQKAGGMLALVDIYCLFNRARGTELISPEDLLRACTLWGKIDVPVVLRRFDSGVMVIQSKSQSDDEVFSRIKSLLIRTTEFTKVGISASEAARALGMAPALAKEQLLAAESKGDLCRDDGPDGLRFFLNFFRELVIERFVDTF
ncbi:hypothetical protein GOP47_0012004 [Adiantum capillus-veneris]|uniref:Vacuolar protein-sorting-associated protein 36 n=2 Tax=Adiantum capillus-veneris TaxID=13818 RepID=A0A9D4ZIB6_ADICA|nr:hypothetical protein GOP47_0012004 [Adiantum capillus-veneris]